VLFVCIENAGRSQIARALFSRLSDGFGEARSAGTQPAARVHPHVGWAHDGGLCHGPGRRRKENRFKIGRRRHDDIRSRWRVDRRRTLVEYVLAADGEMLPGDADGSRSALQNQDAFFAWHGVARFAAGRNAQPPRAQLAGIAFAPLLQRLDTVDARFPIQRVGQHRFTALAAA